MPAQHPPSGGVHKGRGTGGTEMQDRLHILEDLNMLYIRQMALSLEVTPPPPGVHLLCMQPSLSVCPVQCCPGWDGGAQSGERDRWSCMTCVKCCVRTYTQLHQPAHYVGKRVFTPISESSVGGCGCVFWA